MQKTNTTGRADDSEAAILCDTTQPVKHDQGVYGGKV